MMSDQLQAGSQGGGQEPRREPERVRNQTPAQIAGGNLARSPNPDRLEDANVWDLPEKNDEEQVPPEVNQEELAPDTADLDLEPEEGAYESGAGSDLDLSGDECGFDHLAEFVDAHFVEILDGEQKRRYAYAEGGERLLRFLGKQDLTTIHLARRRRIRDTMRLAAPRLSGENLEKRAVIGKYKDIKLDSVRFQSLVQFHDGSQERLAERYVTDRLYDVKDRSKGGQKQKPIVVLLHRLIREDPLEVQTDDELARVLKKKSSQAVQQTRNAWGIPTSRVRGQGGDIVIDSMLRKARDQGIQRVQALRRMIECLDVELKATLPSNHQILPKVLGWLIKIRKCEAEASG